MENTITLTSVKSKDPYFFKINSNAISEDKLLSTEDWNTIIEMVGLDNSKDINKLITYLAYAEDKIVYILDKKLGIVLPAIITSLEDRPDIVTVNIIIRNDKFYVVSHDDIDNLLFFENKADALMMIAMATN